MKNAKFSEAQIMAILRQAENGVPVSELCREHGMSSVSTPDQNCTERRRESAPFGWIWPE